jgi:hypothetical protein
VPAPPPKVVEGKTGATAVGRGSTCRSPTGKDKSEDKDKDKEEERNKSSVRIGTLANSQLSSPNPGRPARSLVDFSLSLQEFSSRYNILPRNVRELEEYLSLQGGEVETRESTYLIHKSILSIFFCLFVPLFVCLSAHLSACNSMRSNRSPLSPFPRRFGPSYFCCIFQSFTTSLGSTNKPANLTNNPKPLKKGHNFTQPWISATPKRHAMGSVRRAA